MSSSPCTSLIVTQMDMIGVRKERHCLSTHTRRLLPRFGNLYKHGVQIRDAHAICQEQTGLSGRRDRRLMRGLDRFVFHVSPGGEPLLLVVVTVDSIWYANGHCRQSWLASRVQWLRCFFAALRPDISLRPHPSTT